MSMSDPEWRDARRDVNRVGRFSIRWVLAVLGLIAVICIAVWYFGVATSDVKGRGDATKLKNDGVNRVTQQAQFNEYFQAIKAADRKITVAKVALDADPKNAVLSTNYNGLQSGCNDHIATYNALARTYTAQEFRDADLPAKIDINDPETDCKPEEKN